MSNLLELTNLHKLVKYVVLPAIDPKNHLAKALTQLWETVDLNQALSQLHNVSDPNSASYTIDNLATDSILTHNPNLSIGENCYSQEFLQQPYAELFEQVRGFNVSWLSHNYYFVWQAYRSQVISEHDLAPLVSILPPTLTLNQVLETLVMSGVNGLGQLCANFDSVMDKKLLAETEVDLYVAILSRLNQLIFRLDLQAQAQLRNQAYTWASFNHYLTASGEADYAQILLYLQQKFSQVGNLLELQRLALFFDQFKVFYTGIRLPVTSTLINQAVSYHQLYVAIASNPQIASADYILVANGNVHLVPDWRIRLSQLVEVLPQLNSKLGQADLVQLMHTLEPRVSNYQLTLVAESTNLVNRSNALSAATAKASTADLGNHIPVFSISNRLVFTEQTNSTSCNSNSSTNISNNISNNSSTNSSDNNSNSASASTLTTNTDVVTNVSVSALSYASIKDYKQHYSLSHPQTLTTKLATLDPKNQLSVAHATLGSAFVQAGNSNSFDQYFLAHSALAHDKAKISNFKAFDEYVKDLATGNLNSRQSLQQVQALGQLSHLRHLSLVDLEQILNYYKTLPQIMSYAQWANQRMYEQFIQSVEKADSIYYNVNQGASKKVLSGYGLREYQPNYTEGLNTTAVWGLPSQSYPQVLMRALALANAPTRTLTTNGLASVTLNPLTIDNKVLNHHYSLVPLANYSKQYLDVFAHNYYQSYLQDLYLNRRYLDLLRLPTLNLRQITAYTIGKHNNLAKTATATNQYLQVNNIGVTDHDHTTRVLSNLEPRSALQLQSQVIALSVEQLQQTGLSYQIQTPTNLFYHPELAASFTISGEILGQAIPNFCTQTLYYLDRNNFSSGDLFLLRKSALVSNLAEKVSFSPSQYYGQAINLDQAKIVHLTPSLGYTFHQNGVTYLNTLASQRLALEQCFSLELDYQQQTVSLGYDYLECYQQYVLAYTPNFNASLSVDGRLTSQDIASYTEQQDHAVYAQPFGRFYQQAASRSFTLFSPQLPSGDQSLWEDAKFSNQQQLYKTVQDFIQLVFCQVSGISPSAQALDFMHVELEQNLVRTILTEAISSSHNQGQKNVPVLSVDLVKTKVQDCYLAIKRLAQALVKSTPQASKLYSTDYHQRFDLVTIVRLALSLSHQELEDVCLQLVNLAQAQAQVRDFKITDNLSPSFNHYINLEALVSRTLIKLHAYQQILQKVLADPSVISTDYVILADINYKFAPQWKFKLNRLFTYLHNLSNLDSTLKQHKAVLSFKFNTNTTDLELLDNNNLDALTTDNSIYYLPQLDGSSLDYLQNLPCYASSLVQAQLSNLGTSLQLSPQQVSLAQIITSDCIAITKEQLTSPIWQGFANLSASKLETLAQLLDQNLSSYQLATLITPSEQDLVHFVLDKTQASLVVTDSL